MSGRPDLGKFQMGCEILENARVLRVGGASRRAGFLYVDLQADQSKDSRLQGFGFSSSQGVCLEFAHLEMNVFKNGAKIAGPFTTPWTETQIFQLDFSQRIDRIVVSHGDVPLQSIFRNSDTSWTVGEFPWQTRVFEDVGAANTTLTPSDTSGAIQITASVATFASNWVNQRLQLTYTQPEDVYKGSANGGGSSGSDAIYGNSVVSSTSLAAPVDPPPGGSDPPVDAVTAVQVYGDWTFETSGDWTGTFTIERSTDSGSNWSTIHTLTSAGTQNFSQTGYDAPGAGNLIRIKYTGSTATSFVFTYLDEITPAVPPGSGSATTVVAPVKVLGDWSFETSGTWTGTFTIERSYDNGASYSPIKSLTSAADKNFILNETEEQDANALFRVTFSGSSKANAPYVFTIAPVDISGQAIVTAYNSTTEVDATVEIPFIADTATSNWKEEAFSPKNGYPKTSTFHQKRLFLGGSKARPQNVYASRTRRPFDFTIGSLDEDGMIFEMDSDGYDSVLWLVSHLSLVVGTTAGIYAISAPDGRSLTPGNNASAKQVKKAGFEGIPGVHVDENVLYLQRKGRKVHELTGGSVEYGGYTSVDLTQLAKQVTQLGVRQICPGEIPDSALYLNSGPEISVLTYERPQNVVGWARWNTQGNFGSTATCPGAGENDDVYVTVNREGVRTVEMLAPDMHLVEEGNTVRDLMFLDSAVLKSEETAFTTIDGLDHLEGRTVTAFADGESQGTFVVAGGEITLNKSVNKAAAGLDYTMRIRPMILDYGSLGSKSATYELRLRVENSLGGKVTQEGKKMSKIPFIQSRRSDGEPPSLQSGDIEAFPHSTWRRGSSITIEHSEPLPFTLLALKVKSKTTP